MVQSTRCTTNLELNTKKRNEKTKKNRLSGSVLHMKLRNYAEFSGEIVTFFSVCAFVLWADCAD